MTGRQAAKAREERRYPLIIEGEEGNYSGYFPDLPGCTTGGETLAGKGVMGE